MKFETYLFSTEKSPASSPKPIWLPIIDQAKIHPEILAHTSSHAPESSPIASNKFGGGEESQNEHKLRRDWKTGGKWRRREENRWKCSTATTWRWFDVPAPRPNPDDYEECFGLAGHWPGRSAGHDQGCCKWITFGRRKGKEGRKRRKKGREGWRKEGMKEEKNKGKEGKKGREGKKGWRKKGKEGRTDGGIINKWSQWPLVRWKSWWISQNSPGILCCLPGAPSSRQSAAKKCSRLRGFGELCSERWRFGIYARLLS